VRALRERARGLADDLLVVLVGDAITEEALPTYQTLINRHEGLAGATGADPSPWAQWSRGWTAEENRHGELLNRYLRERRARIPHHHQHYDETPQTGHGCVSSDVHDQAYWNPALKFHAEQGWRVSKNR